MVKAHFDKFQGGFIFCSLLLTENWFYIDSTVGQTYLPTAFYPWLYFQIFVCCMFAGSQKGKIFTVTEWFMESGEAYWTQTLLQKITFCPDRFLLQNTNFKNNFQIVQTQLFIFSSPEQLNRWSYSTFTFDIQRVMRTWPKFLTIVENFDYFLQFLHFFYNFDNFMKILDNFEFFTTLTIFTFLTIMNCWQFRQFDNFGQVWQPWRAFAILAMFMYYTWFRRIWSHNIISFFPKEHWLKITIETTFWTINLPQKQVFGCTKALKYTFFIATIATVSVPASNMLELKAKCDLCLLLWSLLME